MINGGFAYGYLHIAQNKNVEKVFAELLCSLRPTRILEIGTMHGGLTLMIRDILDNVNCRDSIIRTYDINEQEFLKPLVDERVQIITTNVFEENYSNFKNSIHKREIFEFIEEGQPTLVLCDGGCKKCEYKILSPLLKSGDVIMAHDYAPNLEYFNSHVKDKIWNWLEIQDSDIEESVKSCSLSPYFQELAQQAAWVCKIKE